MYKKKTKPALWTKAFPPKVSTKIKKRLRKISPKQQKLLKAYRSLRKVYLDRHSMCQICKTKLAMDIHHKKRRGKYLLDVSTWLSTCRTCHVLVHENPAWAYKMGYLERAT